MSKLVDELRDAVTDWDRTQMKDEEEPRRIFSCGVLREIAAHIERLEAEKNETYALWQNEYRLRIKAEAAQPDSNLLGGAG